MSGEINMRDAKSAFESFFNKDSLDQTPKTTITKGPNPAQDILNKVKDQSTPPNDKVINKVDTSGDGNDITSLSVDEANAIVEQRKTFQEILKENDIKFSDLFEIIDSFLEKGYYEQKFTIKQFSFAFRTKKVHSVGTINDDLDGAKYTFPLAAEHLILERNLAATLIYYKIGEGSAHLFEHDTEEQDRVALEFVKTKISAPMFSMMCGKLRKFDLYTALATRDEAIDRFLAHTQD